MRALGWVLLMATWATDTFTGPDDAFIHGRSLDGAGIPGLVGRGEWLFHSGEFDLGISIVNEQAVMESSDLANGFIRYGVPDLEGLGNDYSVEVTGQFHSPLTGEPGGSIFGNTTTLGVMVRGNYSETENIRGYEWILAEGNVDDFEGSPVRGTVLILRQFCQGGTCTNSEVELAIVSHRDDDLPSIVADTDYTLRLCVAGNILTGYLNGVEMVQFEIGVDTPVDPGESGDVVLHADGAPGIEMGDIHGITGFPPDPLVHASRWTVTGPGDGITGPPVGPPPPPEDNFIRPMKNGLWRDAAAPSETTQAIQPHAVGQPRVPTAVWVEANGQWRQIVGSIVGPEYNGDPGDEPPDQGCVDAGPLIPTVPPDPLTDRLLFLWDLPPHLINVTPFTASVQGMPSVPGYLGAAAARSGVIIGSQGGYTKFRTGGVYDPDKMDAFIDDMAAMSATFEAAYLAGTFEGVSIFDDFEGPQFWPPSGIPIAEVQRVAARWKSVMGWNIPTLIRGRPVQLVGGSVPSLDGCIAQYRFDLGSPASFMSAELSAAASIGISRIYWSMNLQNGGSGSSGIPGTRAGRWEMSASEVLAAGLQFASSATLSRGIGAWRYDAGNLARAGMIDAWVNIRNALAAL